MQAEISLRLLDADLRSHQRVNSQLRYQAAFAYAKFAKDPLKELCARLTSENPEIRAAAVAVLQLDRVFGAAGWTVHNA